ncbi:hypothetical protein GGG16DRAFT_119678 [Schizophyllum commune]
MDTTTNPTIAGSNAGTNLPPPEMTLTEAVGTISRLTRQLGAAREDAAGQRSSSKRSRAEKDFVAAARGVCKTVTLYDTMSVLQAEADRRDEEGDETVDPEDQRRADREYTAYGLLMKLIPGIGEVITEERNLLPFWAKIEDRARNARADDFRLIKIYSATWVNASPYNCQPPLVRQDRADRGFDNPCTLKLLNSIEYTGHTAEVCAYDPRYLLGNSYYYDLLYPYGKGDPSDTVCAIFTAPGSVDRVTGAEDAENVDPLQPAQKRHKGNHAKATRSNVSALLHMHGVITPRAIAYAAVLLHLNLTNTSEWVEEYYGISYPGFYNFIVDYFEDHDLTTEEGRQAKQNSDATLEWFNRRVFPHNAPTSGDAKASYNKLRAQRHAKATAANAAAVAAVVAAATAAAAASLASPSMTSASAMMSISS